MSSNTEEVIFWIDRDGGIVVSDPCGELMPLFSELGWEIRENPIQYTKSAPAFFKSRGINLPLSHQRLSTIPAEGLWSLHEKIVKQGEIPRKNGDVSYLDLKIELCKRLMESCGLCERRCGINRFEGKAGLCRAGHEGRITREYIHIGEEKGLIPSHTIFFAGCNMSCIFCHELERNRYPSLWRSLTPLDIASLSIKRYTQGVRNINLVGGEPTLYLLTILKALTLQAMPALPIVWNSNMYCSEEVSKLLNGVVDIYLGDLKFGNDRCAEALSDTPDYWNVVTRNLKLARTQDAEIIVRHLPLPGHIECCTGPILHWLANELRGVKVSILVYQPPDHTRPPLNRKLIRRERQALLSILKEAGLEAVEGPEVKQVTVWKA